MGIGNIFDNWKNQSKKNSKMQEEKDANLQQEETNANQEVVDNENTDNTSENINLADINAELAAWKAKYEETNEKYFRLFAEFDNYKRRNAKERIDLLKSAGAEIMLAVLPALDDFDRAIKFNEQAEDIQQVKEGFGLIHTKLFDTLSKKGLKKMESKGTEFDAELHEALTNIPAPSEDLVNKVVDEIECGYYLNDKLIRFAKVVVGS